MHKPARPREFAKLARNLDLLARQRELALFDLDDNACEIVGKSFRVREGHDCLADFGDELPCVEPAIQPHAFGKAAYAEKLARAVLSFGNAIRIEDKHVLRFEGRYNLLVD